jgi:diaminopropionate ammonia-lyase
LYVVNGRAERRGYSQNEAAIVSIALARRAQDEMSTWPGYAPTPLRSLPDWAAGLGVAEVLYKDEASRFGLGSFKALGGAYAAKLSIEKALLAGTGSRPLQLCCATDGNHGRSVAFAAQSRGLACTVFMHEAAPADKASAIIALGASVIRTPGDYDDSVRTAKQAAEREDWLLVADTTEDLEDETPAHVMQGYGVMLVEILEQRASQPPPTHVFLQGGCGGLAAGIAGPMAQVFGQDRPRVVIVEPQAAACLTLSARAGRPSPAPGDLRTSMEMLSCGEVSVPAWSILDRRADAFMTISDAEAERVARELNAQGLSVGVSGAAGLAGLRAASGSSDLRASLDLSPSSRVLVFGTEGA